MGKTVRTEYGTYEVLKADYHRNGMSGIGFFVGLVLGREGEGVNEMFQIITLLSRDPEAPQYDGVPVFVTSINTDAKFRGDNFEDVAWAIVDTVHEQWDADLAALTSREH